MSSESVSKEWREKGNYWYKNQQRSNDVMCCKLCLESALKAYYRAFETASNADETSSAAKNYGMASWRLATVLENLEERPVCVEFQFRESIKYFSKAMVEGKLCKSSEWINELADFYECCVLSGIEYLEDYSSRARVTALESFLNAMCEESQKAACFLELATVISQAGCAALGTKDFVTALQAFHDCYRPVQECFRLSKGCGDIFTEASVVEQDVIFHMATAEAMQAIKIGDDTLKMAIEDDDSINMSMVYDAMDLYKRAVVATREVEVEMEAMAVSRLGSLFDKVLTVKSKARDYFKLCMQLATSLHPRTFNTEPWYKTCVETLRRYQSEAVHTDESAHQAEKEKCLKELENELKDIKGADVGSGLSSMAGLLRHVYKTYPPKNQEHKLNEEGLADSKNTNKNMKKILLTAIQHYHPDKQDKDAHGLKWVVLCEEITKVFNSRYESYKFPPDD